MTVTIKQHALSFASSINYSEAFPLQFIITNFIIIIYLLFIIIYLFIIIIYSLTPI